MFTEEKEMNGDGVLITFRIPLSEWRVIRTSNSWTEVSEMVNRAQRAEDAMTLLLDKKNQPSYCIKYEDIPLMQETIQRMDRLHKRIMISLILPTISMLLSASALILALT